MAWTHLPLKGKPSQSKLFTLTLEEVEVVDAVKAVAEISLMAHNKIRAMQVEEASLEELGVKEVKVQDQTSSKMLQIVESVGVVVRRVTCNVTVQKERQVEKENREIMHLLAEMQVRVEANIYLLCSM